MKNFLVISIAMASILNMIFFFIFFDLESHLTKLIFSEFSILLSGIMVIVSSNSKTHDAYRISIISLFFLFGLIQVLLSYFLSPNLKFNPFLMIWFLLCFIQFVLLAGSYLIKPRP